MATAEQILQAGVDADQYLVGPAVILLQAAANFTGDPDPGDGTGYPRGIDDIIDVANGDAMSGNGWEYLGYTENINPSRGRTVAQHDSDQEAAVKTVHDTWDNTLTVTALETTLAKLRDWLGGDTADPTAAVGVTTPQQYVKFGNPTTIINRRVAIVYMDDSGYLWAFAYRKMDIRPTGGPTFTRTGRVEWALELTAKPDTRVSDIDDRVFRVYKTDDPVT